MKIKILTGATSSGKDTLLKEICKKNPSIKPIISTTSRPMRENEINGREYYFVSEEQAEKMLKNNEFIEKRIYNTENGKWIYGITKNEIDVNSNNEYIVIVDVQGKNSLIEYLLKENVPRKNIHTYYIDCNARIRLERSLYRQPNATDNEVYEMCRRMLADKEEVEKFKNEYDYVLKNETIQDKKDNIEIILDRE